ncbi:hypothetical protein [Chelatococcus asaccharovorans]|uniref:hypothetical protein n=1 Tax=Chelatococcus asaccharovorans TaxID=28210 RepID=UPI0011B427B3|nr:hypothetical protein [Chelatococcus asaccharovorans]MBS7705107.1 hypothetical protein [Chelatococcus asaccharovorans]
MPVTFVEMGRARDGEPLEVQPGWHIAGDIEFERPATTPTSMLSGTLVIEGLTSGTEEIPLLLVDGINLDFPDGEIKLHKGIWTPVRIRVELPGAPDTSLKLEVTHGPLYGAATMIHVPRGQAALATIQMMAIGSVALGALSAELTVTGHSQTGNYIPFSVEVLPPPPPPPSLDKSQAIAEIHAAYLRSGGATGVFGYPTSPVQFGHNSAKRFYRGGHIEARLHEISGLLVKQYPTKRVVVTLVGIKCVKESDHDQLTDTDEPYFVITLINGGDPITKKLGPFQNVRSGLEFGGGDNFRIEHLNPNPLSIKVDAFENDHGDPDETARKLQEKMVELARAAQALAGASGADAADGPGIGPMATAGAVGAVAGPLGSLAAVGIVAALHLGDDYIGQSSQTLFRRPELSGADPDVIGQFKGQPYNVLIDVDGGSEGIYNLFFDVTTREVPPEYTPTA